MNEKKRPSITRLAGNPHHACSILKFLSYSHTFPTVLKVYLPDYNVGKEGVILPLFLYRKKKWSVYIDFFLYKDKTSYCLKYLYMSQVGETLKTAKSK